MTKRKSISKKNRFEVFKRDSFTCQYCGKHAPDVVLVVDHIHPVAMGGGNDIMNLITSCEECNQGKSDRKLDDSSVAKRRMGQAVELQSRREQIEMIAEWQRGLTSLDEESLNQVTAYYRQLVPGWALGESGIASVKPYLTKHGLAAVMQAIRKSAAAHLRQDESGKVTDESARIVCRVFLNSLKYLESNESDPVGSGARYAAGIARNRLPYVHWNHRQVFVDWARRGVPVDALKNAAFSAHSWTNLCGLVEDYILENIDAG